MIRIQQLKQEVRQNEQDLKQKILKLLGIRESDLISFEIRKRSLDARKKPKLYFVYTVDVKVQQEKKVFKKVRKKNISLQEEEPAYSIRPSGEKTLRCRPVVVGTGPAGLFCGYALARMGYRPILLERGRNVDERVADVQAFWDGGALNPESNVQFGEGGAGTFSDGKLNTLTHDRIGRNREVLRLFVKYGAPEQILYENKPHIGTDILRTVVKNIREAICAMGGEVRFHTKLTDIKWTVENDCAKISKIVLEDTRDGGVEHMDAQIVVLAIGHSARDTFSMLHAHKVSITPKSFAVGVRIEHPQAWINRAQYGADQVRGLLAAAYKLTTQTENGRGVYTFCMCPGGYVVNASSEPGRLAVNGMSYSGRSGSNANSAVIVTVTPDDFAAYKEGDDDVLCGMKFQRALEEAAYRAGGGKVPVQRLKDFRAHRASKSAGQILPQIKGGYAWADVSSIFPEEIADSLVEGILLFDRKIPGYASDDALVSGVESRTSSPVRIERNEDLESSIRGLYPCGEGAGYAGGITSAAMDGLKMAEAIARNYRPFDIEKKY